jgi:hypothetical protein
MKTGETNKRSLGRDIHFVKGIEIGLADESKEFRVNPYKIVINGVCGGRVGMRFTHCLR